MKYIYVYIYKDYLHYNFCTVNMLIASSLPYQYNYVGVFFFVIWYFNQQKSTGGTTLLATRNKAINFRWIIISVCIYSKYHHLYLFEWAWICSSLSWSSSTKCKLLILQLLTGCLPLPFVLIFSWAGKYKHRHHQLNDHE